MIKSIIVGLDIGSSTGLAIYDLDRNLIYAGNKRNISIDNLTRDIGLYGKPLIIAASKKKLPSQVSKIASHFGCMAFGPDQDLTPQEKDDIVRIPIKDEQEKEALAAAMYALKRYGAQFKGIDMTLESMGLADLRDKVKELVLNRQARSVAEAVEMLKPRKDAEAKREAPVVETNVDWKEKFAKLELELRDAKRSNSIMKDYCEKLEDKARELERQRRAFIEEEMNKNDDARQSVLKDKEIKKRDILINQLHFELAKLKNVEGAAEAKTEIDEMSEIESENMVPVIIIPEFTRESMARANSKFPVKGRVVWIKKFNASKASANFLLAMGPKIVIGKPGPSIRDMLGKAGIVVVDTLTPQKRKSLAMVSPVDIDGEIAKTRSSGFMDLLDNYKKRV